MIELRDPNRGGGRHGTIGTGEPELTEKKTVIHFSSIQCVVKGRLSPRDS